MKEGEHLNGRSPGDGKESFPTGANARGGSNGNGKNPNGRPPLRSKELEEIILRRMREGESLIEICDDPELPCRDTVFTWLAVDEERKLAKSVPDGEVLFSDRYAVAARIRASAMGEEILSISDDGRNDTYTDGDGKKFVDYDHIQRSKLRVDTRKWLMAKLEPKKYGERPAEVNVQNTISNVVMTEAKRLELIERRRVAEL